VPSTLPLPASCRCCCMIQAAPADVTVQLLEEKTIRLLPRLLSGRLDLAFVRPAEYRDRRLDSEMLFMRRRSCRFPPASLRGSQADRIETLAGQPLIVPDRHRGRTAMT